MVDIPYKIVVDDLNKLRWKLPNQVFISNVFEYSEETVNTLNRFLVPYHFLSLTEWLEFQQPQRRP